MSNPPPNQTHADSSHTSAEPTPQHTRGELPRATTVYASFRSYAPTSPATSLYHAAPASNVAASASAPTSVNPGPTADQAVCPATLQSEVERLSAVLSETRERLAREVVGRRAIADLLHGARHSLSAAESEIHRLQQALTAERKAVAALARDNERLQHDWDAFAAANVAIMQRLAAYDDVRRPSPHGSDGRHSAAGDGDGAATASVGAHEPALDT